MISTELLDSAIRANLSDRARKWHAKLLTVLRDGASPNIAVNGTIVRTMYVHGLFTLQVRQQGESAWTPIGSATSPSLIVAMLCMLMPNTDADEVVTLPADIELGAFVDANYALSEGTAGGPN